MRVAPFLAGLCLASLVACGFGSTSSTGPTSGDLNGRWGWDANGNPAGSSITLTFSTSGEVVTGTGSVCAIGPSCNPGPVTVTGTYVPGATSFSLTITAASGYSATYAGQFATKDRLVGSWTEYGVASTVTFERCGGTTVCF